MGYTAMGRGGGCAEGVQRVCEGVEGVRRVGNVVMFCGSRD